MERLGGTKIRDYSYLTPSNVEFPLSFFFFDPGYRLGLELPSFIIPFVLFRPSKCTLSSPRDLTCSPRDVEPL